MPFTSHPTKIPEVLLMKPKIFSDNRGHFFESYKQSEFAALGVLPVFVQDNFSNSKKDVLRALHFQLPPHTQAKLVGCITGRIFDVAVDIRKASPTFGHWVGVELSEENNLLLYIPEGFAHGFAALEDNTRVMYKCTKEYKQEAERGVRWNDPDLNISWPVIGPIVNERDSAFPYLKDAELF